MYQTDSREQLVLGACACRGDASEARAMERGTQVGPCLVVGSGRALPGQRGPLFLLSGPREGRVGLALKPGQ